MKVIILSSPVGTLGSGMCGGVEATLHNLALQLVKNDHQVVVIAPTGSKLFGISVKEIKGNLQPMMQLESYQSQVILPLDSVLENMCVAVQEEQKVSDVILNFSYDWLPLYLTQYFRCPIVHWLTMSSCSAAFNEILGKVARKFPGFIGAFSRAQADTYKEIPEDAWKILGGAVQLTSKQFCSHPENFIAWAGRISPEKGLEDAFMVARLTKMPLKIMGYMQDANYWKNIYEKYPDVHMKYLGFLPAEELWNAMRLAKTLLVTSKCVEAFGNVAVEAMACGVPVVAYRQGGLVDIIQHGQTGYFVQPGNIEELVNAVCCVDRIDRSVCRKRAEDKFSFDHLVRRVLLWLHEIIKLRRDR